MDTEAVMDYDRYMCWVDDMLTTEPTSKSASGRIVFPARRYLRRSKRPQRRQIALPLAGYTIVTPPGATDAHNASAYHALRKLSKPLSALPGLSCSPKNAWHVTLADLISEGAYAPLVAEGKENDLILEVARLFKKPSLQPCKMKIRGVGLFPDCVVAVVAPANKSAYNTLLRFRRRIYESRKLAELGVNRPEPYGFHITLAYIEAYHFGGDRETLAEVLQNINRVWPSGAIDFEVHTAVFSKFTTMNTFPSARRCSPFNFGR